MGAAMLRNSVQFASASAEDVRGILFLSTLSIYHCVNAKTGTVLLLAHNNAKLAGTLKNSHH